MDKKEIKKLIVKYNKRIKNVKEGLYLDKKEFSIYTSSLHEALKDSNHFTSSGYISKSKETIDFLANDENALKSLIANAPETLTELKTEAKDAFMSSGLYESIKSLDEGNGQELTKAELNNIIIMEVKDMLVVKNEFKEAINEYYDLLNSDIPFNLMGEDNAKMIELSEFINSKGTKSYSELKWFMEEYKQFLK